MSLHEAIVPPPRCGDSVIHRPTGESWLVAYADPERDELSWMGWPAGRAKLSDCALVERCSDEDHADWVDQWRRLESGGDHRQAAVLRLYGHVPAPVSTPAPADAQEATHG